MTDRPTTACDADSGRGCCRKRRRIPAVGTLFGLWAGIVLFFIFWPAHFGQNRVFLVGVLLAAEGLLVLLAALGRWRLLAMAALNYLSAALLTLSFAPWGAWPLAYVAMVPWGIALWMGGDRRGWAVVLSMVGGLVFWVINVYWLTWLTGIGSVAGPIYLSAYWALAAWLVSGAIRRGWPMWIWLAVYWVSVEYLRNYFVAFPWFYLGHSQYMHLRLIQIADTTGQYGVSVLVAMVNGLGVDACLAWRGDDRSRARRVRRVGIGAGVTVLAIGLAVGYGHWRINQDTLRPGPRIAAVQGAFPSTIHEGMLGDDAVFEWYFNQSKPLADCDLILWPEASLPPGMNPEIAQLDAAVADFNKIRQLIELYVSPKRHAEILADEARARRLVSRGVLGPIRQSGLDLGLLTDSVGCPILAGGGGMAFDPVDGAMIYYNMAMWFDESPVPLGTYSKCRLVPFSEYLPMRASCRPVYDWLRSFVPPGFKNAQPGDELTRFDLTGANGRWRIGAPICYEGAFADHCRKLVYEGGAKQADLLVNLSNDGWFTWREKTGWPYRLSAEHSQHLTNYVFRAVESRVPVVRAVNTGISAAIDSNGRILDQLAGEGGSVIPGTPVASGILFAGKKAGNGSWKNGLLVDARVSIYSRIGDIFIYGLCAITIGSVGLGRLRVKVGAKENHD